MHVHVRVCITSGRYGGSQTRVRGSSAAAKGPQREVMWKDTYMCVTLSHYTECQYSDRIETAKEVT